MRYPHLLKHIPHHLLLNYSYLSFLVSHNPNIASLSSSAAATVRTAGEMVGLSIVLESDHVTTSTSNNKKKKSGQVINKVMTLNKKPTPPASPCSRSWFCKSGFLDQCFLCNRRLLPCTDIFMYQGDRAFCSEECRCTQIFMDEQTEMKKMTTGTTKTATPKNNSNRREKCSLAAMRSSATSSPSSRNST